jgi:hypothetical protein
VVELLTVEDPLEVILCTHSYGGLVSADVADRVPEPRSSISMRSLPIMASPGCTSRASATAKLPLNEAAMMDRPFCRTKGFISGAGRRAHSWKSCT